MKDKKQILKELDDAIDRADMNDIERGLNSLSVVEPNTIQAEDPGLFSTRVQKMYKEQCIMNKPRRALRISVVAAVIMAMGITVYAASTLNWFSFLSGDKFVTMRTTESMTEDEAKALVETNQNAVIPDGAVMETPEIQELSFDTVQQAEKELDMLLVLPASLPDMVLDNANAQIVGFGEGLETRTCWLNYSDDQGRLFGVTVVREIIQPGTPVTGYTTHDIDDGSLGSYKSKSGIEYTTLTESDDSGEMTAHIAYTMIGEYEYTLVFVGFEEAERQEIIDSADLSVYK